VARLKPTPVSAGSSLRKVHASVDAAWRAKRRRQIRDSLWWAVPIVVAAGALGAMTTRRTYFGVAFGLLVSAALIDIARCKPRSVTLAGHRASGEAATAKAIKPLRFHGFTALHDRRLPPNTSPGLPPVDIEHLLIGPAGVFLLDSKNWMSGPKPQILGTELWVGREQRADALKRLDGDARNLTDALRTRLPRDVKVEPVMVVHAKELRHLPRIMEGVTVLLPDQFATVFGAMRQRMSATEANVLAQSLDALLVPRSGDRLATS
jgi:hypothetical protein